MNHKGKITSFAVWKTAKIGGIVAACIAALPIAMFIISSTLFHIFHRQPVAPHPGGANVGSVRAALVLLVVGPLIYGIAGFLLTAFASWLYNVLSPRLGGIELELVVAADPTSSRVIPADPASSSN
jgi:hypothetical protein